jgi:hypothetical protein
MYSFPVPLRHGLALLLGLVVTTMAPAQQIVTASLQKEKQPASRADEPSAGSVHRMVILEGPTRRVQYITTGNLSSSDRQATYNLERTENELSYLSDLQQLKQQYVTSERILEPHRRAVQLQLYGRQIRNSNYASTYVNYSPYGSYGYPGGLYGNFGGYYSPFSYGAYRYPGSAYASVSSSANSEIRSLQFGMGNEGVMKNAIVQVMARQTSPEHTAAALRDYDAALSRASASSILSRDLGLPKSSSSAPSAGPSFTKGSTVTIWAGNDKYVGTVKDDRPDWVVLQTEKSEVTVRKAEITRSETSSK